MNSKSVLSLLEQLDDEIDDLDDALGPLVQNPMSETVSKLPLLDKAKLYVLVTYAIESTLFSYLRLNGINAREHPVFKELTRVRQYFDKIKIAETPISKRENVTVDRTAAARFIKAGLTGNDKFDLERAERQATERARAHIRFEELSRKQKSNTLSSDQASEDDTDSDEPVPVSGPIVAELSAEIPASRKKRKASALGSSLQGVAGPDVSGSEEASARDASTYKKKKRKNEKRKAKRN